MKKLMISMIASLAAFSAQAYNPVIGGENETDINDGVISIAIRRNKGASLCTATKISDNAILTASHCFDGMKKGAKSIGYSLILDNSDFIFSPLKIKKIFRHPSYHPKKMNLGSLDMAIVIVEPDNIFPLLDTVEISYEPVLPDAKVKFIGYGCQLNNNATKSFHPVKKSGESTVISKEVFRQNFGLLTKILRKYTPNIEKAFFITPGTKYVVGSPSLCHGDSGGPVLLDGKLVGTNTLFFPNDVNRKGKSPSGLPYINLHTRVSGLEAWIQAKTGLN